MKESCLITKDCCSHIS